MNDKRTTRDIVIRLDEKTDQFGNRLDKIDKRLEKLNGYQGKQDERMGVQDVKIAKNTTGVKNLYWILGGAFFGSGGILFLALYLLDIIPAGG